MGLTLAGYRTSSERCCASCLHSSEGYVGQEIVILDDDPNPDVTPDPEDVLKCGAAIPICARKARATTPFGHAYRRHVRPYEGSDCRAWEARP